MAQDDWLDRLTALVGRSAGSLNDAGDDRMARLLRESPGAAVEAEGAATPSTSGAALTERMLSGTAASLSTHAVSLGERLIELAQVTRAQARSVEENTAALAERSPSKVTDTLKSAVNSFSGSSLLSTARVFSPVISGIARLFGGGEPESTPEPVPFVRPTPIRLEAGISSGGNGEIRYDADGVPRAIAPNIGAAPSQINISVQAIDSRSFLDHSEEIARAVREAMLQSHALSDIVSEF